MKTDTIFYSVFQEFPSIFFELIGRPDENANAYQFTSIELKQAAFRIDGLLIPISDNPERPIYFIEVQFQKDEKLYSRLFAEIFLYLNQYASNQDWRAVIVYPRRSLEPTETIPYRTLLASEQVQQVYINELGEAAERSLGLGIVQLVIERESQAVNRARQLISQARQQVQDAASQQRILELIETVILYKFSNLSREEIQAMLGLDEFKQSRLYREIREEVLEEGREQGIEAGREQGKLEGKLESVPQLLALGLSVEQVATALNLTIEQVQQASERQA